MTASEWVNTGFDIGIAIASAVAAWFWLRAARVPYNAGAPPAIPMPSTPKGAWPIAGRLNALGATAAGVAALLSVFKALWPLGLRLLGVPLT